MIEIRPGTFATPGLGGKTNGQIERILRSWSRQQKTHQKQKEISTSANKRKKFREREE